MVVKIKNPDAPATKRQMYKLHELTGRDTRSWRLTMQQASDKIEELELEQIPTESLQMESMRDPFTEAHVTIIEGQQRSGKTVTAVARLRDTYDKDCVRIYCEKVLGIKCLVKAYYRRERVAKIKHDGKIKLIRIPKEYELKSPMRIFANIHLFGIPYVFIPSFRHLLHWLKKDIIRDGWLLIDEAQKGMNARSSMTELGRELEVQGFQLGKMQLDVIIITHMARLIDWALRTVPTESLNCTYDKKTRKVTYVMKKKGEQGSREITYDATQYFANYWTNEKINA